MRVTIEVEYGGKHIEISSEMPEDLTMDQLYNTGAVQDMLTDTFNQVWQAIK